METSVIRQYVKEQVAYLKENAITAGEVADDQVLFSDEDGGESLGLDSLDAVELSLALESEFDLADAPGDIDLRQFRTVDDIVEFVVSLLEREPAIPTPEAGE